MKPADVRMLFRVNAAFIEPSQTVALSGSIAQLGFVRPLLLRFLFFLVYIYDFKRYLFILITFKVGCKQSRSPHLRWL